MFETRDAVNILVCIIEMLVTHMVKALMPKKTFGINMKLLELQFGS
jgi:hypothetical protein